MSLFFFSDMILVIEVLHKEKDERVLFFASWYVVKTRNNCRDFCAPNIVYYRFVIGRYLNYQFALFFVASDFLLFDRYSQIQRVEDNNNRSFHIFLHSLFLNLKCAPYL